MGRIYRNVSELFFPFLCINLNYYVFSSDMKVSRQNYTEVSDVLELGLCNFRPLGYFPGTGNN